MMEEIRVTIQRDGQVVFSVNGKCGPQCLTVTEAFERKMGDVLDRQRTNQFYKKAQIAMTGRNLNPLKSA
jgi:hypothetical protein